MFLINVVFYEGSVSAADEELMGELTLDELKMAFRLIHDRLLNDSCHHFSGYLTTREKVSLEY